MDSTNALVRVVDQPALDAIAVPLSDGIKQVYSRAGNAGQIAKNTLHGVWLGHPLHPVFTDIRIGAWTTVWCGLAHACSHLGGPLSEGTLKDGSVLCDQSAVARRPRTER